MGQFGHGTAVGRVPLRHFGLPQFTAKQPAIDLFARSHREQLLAGHRLGRNGRIHVKPSYSVPRMSCSLSIASNSALKLPFPKLFQPGPWITSNNSVGRSATRFAKIYKTYHSSSAAN